MSNYGINNADASLHLRLPTSMLDELKVICAKEDCGGLSSLVRRAIKAYIMSQHPGIQAYQKQQVTPVPPVTPRQSSSPDADLEFLTKADTAYVSYLENSDFNVHARRNLAAERVKTLRSQSVSKQTLPPTPTAPPPARPTFDLSNVEGNTPVDRFMGRHT
jgi:hypothetical protein